MRTATATIEGTKLAATARRIEDAERALAELNSLMGRRDPDEIMAMAQEIMMDADEDGVFVHICRRTDR